MLNTADAMRSDEEDRLRLRFLESMDLIHRAFIGIHDFEQTMRRVLDALLLIFECDRVWLLFPCDPTAPSWWISVESVRPEFRGAAARGMSFPMTSDMADCLKTVLASEIPIGFGPGSDLPLPIPGVAERFGVQSLMGQALHPGVGSPWMLDLCQCSSPRVWSDEERGLFREVGRRLSDLLEGLLTHRDLRERELRYRQVFENSSDGIFLLDVMEDGRFRFSEANPAEEQSVGMANSSLAGRYVEDIVSAEIARQVTANYRRCIEAEQTISYDEVLSFAAGARSFNTTLIPIRDAQGRIIRIIGFSRDTTERTEMVRALETHNQHARSLLRLSRSLERAQSYADVVDAAFHEVKDVIGYQRVWIYVLTDDQQEADGVIATTAGPPMQLPRLKMVGDPMLEEIASGNHIVVVEDALTDPRTDKEMVAKQGHRTLINVPIILFDNHLGSMGTGSFDEEGVRVPTAAEQEFLTAIASHLAVSLDRIHTQIERNRAEEELRRHREHLEELVIARTADLEAANRELEAFSYSVSHDLRTPLRAIDGFSSLLARRLGNTLDEEGKRLIRVVRENSAKMARLIDDILAFSRSGHAEILYSDVDMNEMVQSVWADLDPQRAGRNVNLDLSALPPVRGDSAMLRQVWTNLISNAIKFTRQQPEARIEIRGVVVDDSVEYSVKDNGVGFDPAFAAKLFQVFQRIHSVDEFEGTGIGLAIVKRIVDRHGGRVMAEGEVGKGATLRFTIPR